MFKAKPLNMLSDKLSDASAKFRLKTGKGIPVSKAYLEFQYERGDWDYLEGEDEAAHYHAIVCLYMSHNKNGSVLDVGCGTGITYGFLKRDAGICPTQYFGVDISEHAVSKAAAQFPEASFACMDFNREASFDQQFDCIIFNETLYYFEHPIALLQRCAARYLRPHGTFIISMYGTLYEEIWKRIAHVFNVAEECTVMNEQKQQWTVKLVVPR